MITAAWVEEHRLRAQMAESITLPVEIFRELLDLAEQSLCLRSVPQRTGADGTHTRQREDDT